MSYEVPEGWQMPPHMHLRRVASMAGLGWVQKEAVRNCVLHGKATRVAITIEQEPIAGLVLSILGDGTGMNAKKRLQFGGLLGVSDLGNGTGIRDTALSLCQVLECYTIDQDDPGTVHYLRLPNVEWIFRITCNDWHGEWQSFPRLSDRNLIPESLRSGTLVRLSDFRRSNYQDPFNPERMVDTSAQVTVEKSIEAVKHDLREYVHLITVNDRRVKLGPLPGFKLWQPEAKQVEGLGSVGGHINVAVDPEGHLLKIGGATSTIAFSTLVTDLMEHNPSLAARIPAVFKNNRQLIGSIRIEALEAFAAQQREHLLPDFFVTPAAQLMVDELVSIAEEVNRKLVIYRREMSSHQTRSCIKQIAANINHAGGYLIDDGTGPKPGVVPTEGSSSSQGGSTLPPEDVAPLELSVSSLRLEQWDGQGERDEAAVCVDNPMGGETFTWSDFGAKIIVDTHGSLATVTSSKTTGTNLCRVTSDQYPQRTADFNVSIRGSDDMATKPTAFKCVPSTLQMEVGEQRLVRVTRQGQTSGDYEWIYPDEGDNVGIECVTQPGNRRLQVRACTPGVFEIVCRDKNNPSFTFKTKVTVRSKRNVPTTKGGGSAGGKPSAGSNPAAVSSANTPTPATTVITGTPGAVAFAVELDGETFKFEVEASSAINSTFYADPANSLISVGDIVASRLATDNKQRGMHVANAMAHGVIAILLSRGELSPSDIRRHERLVDFIVGRGMAKR